jgi:ribosomal protein S18 acetylase RimI-like enzyme
VRLKASRDGKLIGAVFGDRRRHENLGWIASLAVHPTLQRRGVGRLLLAACEQALAMPRIRLTLRRSNERARHLYDRAGYVLTDVWQRYYRNGEDGLVMEKDWSAGSVEAG